MTFDIPALYIFFKFRMSHLYYSYSIYYKLTSNKKSNVFAMKKQCRSKDFAIVCLRKLSVLGFIGYMDYWTSARQPIRN